MTGWGLLGDPDESAADAEILPLPKPRKPRREPVRCAAKIHLVQKAGDACPMCDAIAAGHRAAIRRSAPSW